MVTLACPDYLKIKDDAKSHGHRAVSDYVRKLITGNTIYVEKKIVENNKMLKLLVKEVCGIEED